MLGELVLKKKEKRKKYSYQVNYFFTFGKDIVYTLLH